MFPEEADADSGGIRLPGPDGTEGTDDDDLHRFNHMDTDGNGELSQEELLAQIAVSEEEFADENRDGGAVFLGNQATGTIQYCDFVTNSTPVEGDDGGAITVSGRSVLTVIDCWFDGNSACSATGVSEEGADGDGGHIKVQGDSESALVPGTTLIAQKCVFLNGRAEDDGGAIKSTGDGTVVRLDSC
ncbi:MAG: EF-hand domain-containing protein, partial [Planctomycetota bacterium]